MYPQHYGILLAGRMYMYMHPFVSTQLYCGHDGCLPVSGCSNILSVSLSHISPMMCAIPIILVTDWPSTGSYAAQTSWDHCENSPAPFLFSHIIAMPSSGVLKYVVSYAISPVQHPHLLITDIFLPFLGCSKFNTWRHQGVCGIPSVRQTHQPICTLWFAVKLQ